MKNLLKKLSTMLSIVLMIAITVISLSACSNSNKTATKTVETTVETVDQIDDSGEKEEIADKVSDSEEESSDEISNTDELVEDEIVKSENTPILNKVIETGVYVYADNNFTFDNIYYTNEEALLEYFETTDLNGVYDVVKKLGFDEFIKDFDSVIIDEKVYNFAFSIGKDEKDPSSLILCSHIIQSKNSLNSFGDYLVYKIEDGKMIVEDCNPEFLTNSDGSVSMLIPFFYYTEENDIPVKTPLYIKADLVKISSIDIISGENLMGYCYVDGSTKIISKDGFISNADATKILAEILKTSPDSLIDEISQFEFYFNSDKELIVFVSEHNINLTEKLENNTYLLYESCYLKIVNESLDLTTNISTIEIQIEIDEFTTFTFKCECEI